MPRWKSSDLDVELLRAPAPGRPARLDRPRGGRRLVTDVLSSPGTKDCGGSATAVKVRI